jgi:hypothetical protein
MGYPNLGGLETVPVPESEFKNNSSQAQAKACSISLFTTIRLSVLPSLYVS